MKHFDINEIFQLAIRIEENGEQFYRTMSKKLKDKKLQDLFDYLADQEVKHKELFELMVSNIEEYEPIENFPKEYFAYIRALADDVLFDEEKSAEEIGKIKDAASAIEYAKGKESNSILYYQGLKNLVSENQRAAINKIIEEEQTHFVELSSLKKLIT